jgi:protein-glutamine gamma-glutamyltransferase
MTPKAREIETLLLAMFAAVPLYFTQAINPIPVVLFHVFMIAVAVRIALGKGPELLPGKLMRIVAVLYVPFYVIDWLAITHSAVAASTHLVLFIAAYQPSESVQRANNAQRMLTAGLIFTASVATSTHITIVPFIAVFAYLIFRQMMFVSHLETVRTLELPYAEPPAARAATFYLAGATVIAAMLFPLLPRVRNPFVQGLAGALPGATTGLSETIDFRDPRATTSNDATIVARVWMDDQARPFFTPLRLRGNLYDRFEDGEWQQTFRGLRWVNARGGAFTVAKPLGFTRTAIVQMRPQGGKLFLPVGTYAVSGASTLYEGPSRETYHTYDRGMLNLTTSMAFNIEPLRSSRPPAMSGYPISPAVTTLAKEIVGAETQPARQAALIENYLVRNYRYVATNAAPAQAMSLEEFLLNKRAGHCEYFAAAMVALLNAVDVPARIAGGFYGGRLNPLTGYYAVRREDAHAWTEVWDGQQWRTFDATPPTLRPGSEQGSAFSAYMSAVSDSVTYFWDRYVLTFGLSDQIALTADLITWVRDEFVSGRATLRDNVRALVTPRFGFTLAIVIVAGFAAIAFARRRSRPYDLVARFLKQRGIEVTEAMTMEDALRGLGEDAAREIAPLVALYEEEEFSGRRDPSRRRELRRMLAELR